MRTLWDHVAGWAQQLEGVEVMSGLRIQAGGVEILGEMELGTGGLNKS